MAPSFLARTRHFPSPFSSCEERCWQIPKIHTANASLLQGQPKRTSIEDELCWRRLPGDYQNSTVKPRWPQCAEHISRKHSSEQRPLQINVHPDFCHLLNTEGQAEAFGKGQDSLSGSQDIAFVLTICFSIPSLEDTDLSVRQLLGAKTLDIIAKHMLKRDWKLCWQCYRGEQSTALGQNKQKKKI